MTHLPEHTTVHWHGMHIVNGSEGPRLDFMSGSTPREIEGSHILVAVGRRPNTDDLGLDKGGIEVDLKGAVDDRLHSTSAEGSTGERG